MAAASRGSASAPAAMLAAALATVCSATARRSGS
jgi:hypothetical protein